MRFVLVSLIVLVQVAGPWLCCCAPAQGATTAKPTPVPSKPVNCPHCLKSEPTAPAVPAEPHPSRPLPDPCPCGGFELVAVPAERKATADEVGTFVVELPGLPAPFAPVLSQAVAACPGLRDLPWMTTADRLFAHHVLRC